MVRYPYLLATLSPRMAPCSTTHFSSRFAFQPQRSLPSKRGTQAAFAGAAVAAPQHGHQNGDNISHDTVLHLPVTTVGRRNSITKGRELRDLLSAYMTPVSRFASSSSKRGTLKTRTPNLRTLRGIIQPTKRRPAKMGMLTSLRHVRRQRSASNGRTTNFRTSRHLLSFTVSQLIVGVRRSSQRLHSRQENSDS